MNHTGKAAAIFLILAIVISCAILSESALAQEPDAIGITPFIWIEHKYMEWNSGWWEYHVNGWWFEDGDYYHVGDWRDFKINFDVYKNILEPWADGNIARVCKLGFKDNDNFASSFFCWPSFQSFLPYTD